MSLIDLYRAAIENGELKPDIAQEYAVERLSELAAQLDAHRPSKWRLFSTNPPVPRGVYIWGDVGRGKSMLMDLFYESLLLPHKLRIHFNAFMVETHASIHTERQRAGAGDPIPPVAQAIAAQTQILCFDEFQVTDVADAMILGRLFDKLFELGTVIVATSNTSPDRLYEGGLNRQLFLPFIAEIKSRLDEIELDGPVDYRLLRMSGLDVYLTPIDAASDRAMDLAWQRLTDQKRGGETARLTVLGRKIVIPQAAKGVARFDFGDLCVRPLGAADYLAIAHSYHTVLIDHIPQLGPAQRNEARRFTLLIDTFYDEGVKLICSAEVGPDDLFATGDGAMAFRRTASRLHEMQSVEYLKLGHGAHLGERGDLS